MIRILLFALPILPAALRLEIYRIADREIDVHHPDRVEIALAIANLEARSK